MPIQPGMQLGAYQVQELLGQGAMGLVYLAYHPALARHVAVKVLHALAPDPDAANRFRLEARAIAQLRHPNILNVFDYGGYEGTPYMVVEYLPGGSLADRLRQGPMSGVELIGVLQGVAAALDHAHSVGIVHRDVKPANVLRQSNGSPVLADFGLAKLMLQSGVLTATGTTTGTPAYMAPEQVMGGTVGPPADRYSLAAMAYESLTGQPPFTGEAAMELLYAHVHRDPPPPTTLRPELGASVDGVLLRGLAKDPAARWESCEAMVRALSEALTAKAIPSLPLPTALPPARRPGFWRVLAGGGLVGLLMVAVFAGLQLQGRPSLSLSTASAQQGNSVVVSGHHLPANVDGKIQVSSEATDLGFFRSDGSGDFRLEVNVPDRLPPGSHQVLVCWNQQCPLTSPLQVSARPRPSPVPSPSPSPSPSPIPSPSPPPSIDVQPAAPRLGGAVQVKVAGLSPNQRAFVIVVQTNSARLLANDLAVQANGTLSAAANLPAGLKPGPALLRVCNGDTAQGTNCQEKAVTLVP